MQDASEKEKCMIILKKILKMNLVRVNFVEMPAQIGPMSLENKEN